ncbi:hypothetical protein EG68_10358 [Paragonimus skrjabini miyazakii]|uniref:Uncharacterized protein n=1 Tax=Paragonimus skrjabini miyazakii TaxID=59628 RepID=A0A8S9YJB4_9TREM|nr:hypothetical protein EG68_10358 [Paragonimus skrjabini miyazakii]
MGPYILSFLSEEAARMFRSTGVHPTAPAPVIRETLRQLFEKTGTPGSLPRAVFQSPPETGGIGRHLPEIPPGTRFKGIQTAKPRRLRAEYLRTVLYGPPEPGPTQQVHPQANRKLVGRSDKGERL